MDDGICGENSDGRMAAITILSSVCVLTVFGNTMVLLAFFRNRSLRSFGNYFLISLAISDLVMGCWTFPNTIANLVLCKSWMSELMCEMSGYIDNVILTNSLVTLAACSYDRYLVITKPLFYKRSMTGRRTLLILSATWIYSASLSLPPFLGIGKFKFSEFSRTCALTMNDHDQETGPGVRRQIQKNFEIYFSSYMILTFIPPLSMMIGCYYYIFQTARQVTANDPCLTKKSSSSTTSPSNPWKGIKNYKAGLMIAVIIGIYLVFVVPVMLLACLQVLFHVEKIPKDAALIVVYLVMCNSFCNPIIYGIMNKEFRKTFKNIVYCRSDRAFRQMNYRKESLAYSSSCNGTVLLKRNLSNSNTSSLSMGSIVSSNKSVLSRQNSELKRYLNGKRNSSLGGKDSNNCVLQKGGTIVELSEHSTSDCHNNSNHNNRDHVTTHVQTNSKPLVISELNPFRFIWNIKSSSYECISNFRSRKRTISF